MSLSFLEDLFLIFCQGMEVCISEHNFCLKKELYDSLLRNTSLRDKRFSNMNVPPSNWTKSKLTGISHSRQLLNLFTFASKKNVFGSDMFSWIQLMLNIVRGGIVINKLVKGHCLNWFRNVCMNWCKGITSRQQWSLIQSNVRVSCRVMAPFRNARF